MARRPSRRERGFPGEVEEVLREPAEPLHLAEHVVERLAVPRAEGAAGARPDQLDRAADDADGVADLVRQHRGHLADRREALAPHQLGPQPSRLYRRADLRGEQLDRDEIVLRQVVAAEREDVRHAPADPHRTPDAAGDPRAPHRPVQLAREARRAVLDGG